MVSNWEIIISSQFLFPLKYFNVQVKDRQTDGRMETHPASPPAGSKWYSCSFYVLFVLILTDIWIIWSTFSESYCSILQLLMNTTVQTACRVEVEVQSLNRLINLLYLWRVDVWTLALGIDVCPDESVLQLCEVLTKQSVCWHTSGTTSMCCSLTSTEYLNDIITFFSSLNPTVRCSYQHLNMFFFLQSLNWTDPFLTCFQRKCCRTKSTVYLK